MLDLEVGGVGLESMLVVQACSFHLVVFEVRIIMLLLVWIRSYREVFFIIAI